MSSVFYGTVHVGVPNAKDNRSYKSATGLTKTKLLSVLAEDGFIVQDKLSVLENDDSWFEDLIQTGHMLRLQCFVDAMFTTSI